MTKQVAFIIVFFIVLLSVFAWIFVKENNNNEREIKRLKEEADQARQDYKKAMENYYLLEDTLRIVRHVTESIQRDKERAISQAEYNRSVILKLQFNSSKTDKQRDSIQYILYPSCR